jgi:hypothetical protein
MSHFTLAASGVIIDAFQWNGGALSNYTLPFWALPLSLQTAGDGTLYVPAYEIMPAMPSDWVGKGPTGNVFTMSAAIRPWRLTSALNAT